MKITISILGNRKVFDLESRPLVIGRGSDCDFCVVGAGSETVSGKHTLLRWTEGRLMIEDLGSSNGTWVNGSRCTKSLPLQAGDSIALGMKGPEIQWAIDASREPSGDQSRSKAPKPGVVPLHRAGSQIPIENRHPPAHSYPASSPPHALPSSPQVAQAPLFVAPNSRPSTTRQLLISFKQSNRIAWAFATLAGCFAVLIAGGVGVFYWVQISNAKQQSQTALITVQDTQEAVQEDVRRELGSAKVELQQQFESLQKRRPELYKRCALSTALIFATDSKARTGSRGSGFLVDRDRGHILTNHHVVADRDQFLVWFPELRADGGIENRLGHYMDAGGVKPLVARLIASDASKDLALIQVDFGNRFPATKALKLAKSVPPNGVEVFTFGSPASAKKVAWTFTDGVVRNFEANWKAILENQQTIQADVIYTNNPTDPGDSGGPVVDDKGEVVAVVSSHSTNARMQSQYIAVTEIHRFYRPLSR